MIVRAGGCFQLKPGVMLLFMLCNAVSVEWLLLSYCIAIFVMLFVMYGSKVFSKVLAYVEIV